MYRRAAGLGPSAAIAHQVGLLTGQRRMEILRGRRDEIEPEEGWWEIPGSRTKNGRPSRVYLVPLALELLGRIPDVGPWLFPSSKREDRNLKDVRKATERATKRSGVTNWTFKVLRATLATRMAEIGIEPFTISQVLNHASSGAARVTDAHYIDPSVAKYQHGPQKRAAMIRYADRLSVELGEERSKVLPFSG